MNTTKQRLRAGLVLVALVLALLPTVPVSASARNPMVIHVFCKLGWSVELVYHAPQGLTSEQWLYSNGLDRYGHPRFAAREAFVCHSNRGCSVTSFRKGQPTILWDTVWVQSWGDYTQLYGGARCLPPGQKASRGTEP